MHKGARKRKVRRSRGWYIRIFVYKPKSAFHRPTKRRESLFSSALQIYSKEPAVPTTTLVWSEIIRAVGSIPQKGGENRDQGKGFKTLQMSSLQFEQTKQHTINYTKIYNQKFRTEEHMISHELHILVIPKPSQTVSGLSKFIAPSLPFNPTSINLNTTLR